MDKLVLTSKQQEIVNSKSADLLIRGIAGSGKTLVILRKAKQLAEANPNNKIAIFTYNKALQASADYQVKQFGLHNLTVKTFHSWAYNALKHIGMVSKVLNSKESSTLIKKAIVKGLTEESRFRDKKYMEFVSNEISWIKGMGIQTRQEYLKASRAGRGNDIRLSKDDRNSIYTIKVIYEKSKGRKLDYNDYALNLYKRKERLCNSDKYDVVFIDEAQDLQMIQLKLLREIALEKFIVAADKGQKIYTSSFTWKDIGLNIKGGRTKILDETFRSTRPIIELARSMQKNDIIKNDDEFIECKIPSQDGVIPTWYQCKDHEIMAESILSLISNMLTNSKRTIGVLSREWRVLGKLKTTLQNNGYYPEVIKGQDGNAHTPGVKLTTFHSAKGLEFDYVIIVADKQNNKVECDPNIERRLFYVSMTRAKAALYIFTQQGYSDILDELDGALYRLEKLS